MHLFLILAVYRPIQDVNIAPFVTSNYFAFLLTNLYYLPHCCAHLYTIITVAKGTAE